MSLSDSKCPLDPYTCECSSFYEWFKEKEGITVRWIECDESYQDEEANWHEKNKGAICKHNPPDWWDVYMVTAKASKCEGWSDK